MHGYDKYFLTNRTRPRPLKSLKDAAASSPDSVSHSFPREDRTGDGAPRTEHMPAQRSDGFDARIPRTQGLVWVDARSCCRSPTGPPRDAPASPQTCNATTTRRPLSPADALALRDALPRVRNLEHACARDVEVIRLDGVHDLGQIPCCESLARVH